MFVRLSKMQGLPDNPASEESPEDPVMPCEFPTFSVAQCPKALTWLASLALAAGQRENAEGWLVEAIGALLFRVPDASASTDLGLPAKRVVVSHAS